MQRVIRLIPPVAPPIPRLLRVAAYARVSSGKDAMLHSLSSQVSYYNTYIQNHKGWTFAGIYVDEALTGTKDMRDGFLDLLAACRAGEIDIVLTKSISRFARNTVTLLEVVRELKEIGVDVYFERENIHSISEDGELMLTILASYAQEESRSASENTKWRIRKMFENGELACFRYMYGYRITKGIIRLENCEAGVVQAVFGDYIGGLGATLISRNLVAQGVPPLRGGSWSPARVIQMIKNEKYTGNALLQKKYVVDHLTKKEVWNRGELPQFYAEDTHPAIITMDIFEMAQEILQQRREAKNNTLGAEVHRYPFTSRIVCGNCGKHYRRKTTHGKRYWQCSTFMNHGAKTCPARQIPESVLQRVSAMVLGLQQFDEGVFEERVSQIIVLDGSTLSFQFKDGTACTETWQYDSRSESWTDDMRRAQGALVSPEQRARYSRAMSEMNRERWANHAQSK